MKCIVNAVALVGLTIANMGLAKASTGNPGSSCVPEQSTTFPFYVYGMFQNKTSNWATVDCPISFGTLSGNSQSVSSMWLNLEDLTSTQSGVDPI